jgi:hypothetical protein
MTLVNADTGEVVTTLEDCEAVIERGLGTFVEVGNALISIRDGKLYRQNHDTFEAYCDKRWGLKRQRAYQLIEAAEVAEAVSQISDIRIARESHAKALAPVKKNPEQMAEAMQRASVIAAPTAERIAQAVKDIVREEAVKAVQRAEDREAISDLSAAATRAGLDTNPDRVRQRGEFSRLCRDIAALPDAGSFIADHGNHLRDRHGVQAQQAHAWLTNFCELWGNR